MSELFDKQVNTEKEKASGVHASSHKPTKKCAMKMKVELEEKTMCVYNNVIDGKERVYKAPVHGKVVSWISMSSVQVNDS